MKADKEVIHFINEILNTLDEDGYKIDLEWENELNRIIIIK
ncbi:MAG TPA: hypothetical protein VIR31_05820 [Nitrososphaeraceae archaeon]